MSDLSLLSGGANLPFAEAVAQTLGLRLGVTSMYRFPDGELHVAVRHSLRGGGGPRRDGGGWRSRGSSN